MARKHKRDLDQFLGSFGYTFAGFHGSSHYRYENKDGEFMTAPTSPSDWRWRQNLLGELRQKHPDVEVQKRNSPGPREQRRSQRRGDGKAKRSFYALPDLEPDVEIVETPEHTSCIRCGRRWLSDLDPRGRSCPDCGGEIVIGRAA